MEDVDTGELTTPLLEIDRAADGGWTVRVRGLPEVEVEADTRDEALEPALAAAFRSIAELMERNRTLDRDHATRRLEEALDYAVRVLAEVEDQIDRDAAGTTRDEPSIPWSAVRDEL
jgi:predicted RNase H-like HicB family nuclease